MWSETINKEILLKQGLNNCRKININVYDEFDNSIFLFKYSTLI